jgi:hypothetical protein
MITVLMEKLRLNFLIIKQTTILFIGAFTLVLSFSLQTFADEAQYEVFDMGAFEPIFNFYNQSCGYSAFLSANGKAAYTRPYTNKSYIFEPIAGETIIPGFFDPASPSYFYVSGIDNNANVVGMSAQLPSYTRSALEFMPTYVPSGGAPQSIDLEIGGYNAITNKNRAFAIAGSSDSKHFIGYVQPAPEDPRRVVTWSNRAPATADRLDFDGARFANLCAINNSGDAVGITSTPPESIIRRAGGTYILLTASTLGVDESLIPQTAVAINNSGLILLNQPFTFNRGVARAALTNGTSLTVLSGMKQAYGLNNFGEVVGSSPQDVSKGSYKQISAMLYKGGSYYDLNNMIDPTPGIFLTKAIAINDNRTIIALGYDASSVLHTYYLRETTPFYQPDLLIGTGSKGVGLNIFNTTGSNQKSSFDIKAGKSKTFSITVKNAGRVSDSFVVVGSKSSTKFSVKYYLGKTEITSLMTGKKGYQITKLASQKSKTISAVFKALRKSTSSSSFSVQAISQTDSKKKDKLLFSATSK